MESRKGELMHEMQEKGMTVEKVAEAIEFSPALLSLYFKEDAYPVPTRILDKVAGALNN